MSRLRQHLERGQRRLDVSVRTAHVGICDSGYAQGLRRPGLRSISGVVNFEIGDRVGVVTGNLVGCYGHVSDRLIKQTGEVQPMVGVRIQGHHTGESRFIGQEWFIPTKRLEHVD